jgi:hypothetical protein
MPEALTVFEVHKRNAFHWRTNALIVKKPHIGPSRTQATAPEFLPYAYVFCFLKFATLNNNIANERTYDMRVINFF